MPWDSSLAGLYVINGVSDSGMTTMLARFRLLDEPIKPAIIGIGSVGEGSLYQSGVTLGIRRGAEACLDRQPLLPPNQGCKTNVCCYAKDEKRSMDHVVYDSERFDFEFDSLGVRESGTVSS